MCKRDFKNSRSLASHKYSFHKEADKANQDILHESAYDGSDSSNDVFSAKRKLSDSQNNNESDKENLSSTDQETINEYSEKDSDTDLFVGGYRVKKTRSSRSTESLNTKINALKSDIEDMKNPHWSINKRIFNMMDVCRLKTICKAIIDGMIILTEKNKDLLKEKWDLIEYISRIDSLFEIREIMDENFNEIRYIFSVLKIINDTNDPNSDYKPNTGITFQSNQNNHEASSSYDISNSNSDSQENDIEKRDIWRSSTIKLLKDNLEVLQRIVDMDPKKAINIIDKSSGELHHVIRMLSRSILDGTIPLQKHQVDILKNHKILIRDIAKSNNNKTLKKLLFQKGGSFFNSVLSTVLPLIPMLL